MLPDSHTELTQILNISIKYFDNPKGVMRQLRGFRDEALKYIWDALLQNREIPDEWIAHLPVKARDNIRLDTGQVSNEAKFQLHLLREMTGDRTRVRIPVSQKTYVLISNLSNLGDFGQHLGDEDISKSFVASALLSACDLVVLLDLELSESEKRTRADADSS